MTVTPNIRRALGGGDAPGQRARVGAGGVRGRGGGAAGTRRVLRGRQPRQGGLNIYYSGRITMRWGV